MTLLRFLSLATFLLIAAPTFAQTFNPADWGNVVMHLKADALGLADNAPVAAWGPLTGASGAQPIFKASDSRFNGKPVVKFDGVDDVLTQSTVSLNAQTIFIVTTLETGAANLAGLISNGSDNLNIRRNGTALFYRSPGQGLASNDFVGGTPAGTLSVNNVASGAFTVGSPHLVIAVAGAQKNFSTFWLGNARSTLARFWNGAVAEMIVYDGALTPTGIDQVGYYLQAKYNLPTNFPAPTPTIPTFTATTAGGIGPDSTGVLSTAGANVTLAWVTNNANNVSIDQGVLAGSSNPSGSATVSPTVTTTYTISATNAAGTVTKQVTVHIGVTPLPPQLNEFVADNEDGITDVDGAFSDWIEVFNPNAYAVDLQGYALKNGPTQATANQWNFPAASSIPSNGYRVVFASQKNLTNPANALHTDFSLEKSGEYLALVRVSDGAATTEFAPAYPPQFADVSYGWWNSPAQLGYFGKPTGAPTPGAANSPLGVLGFLDMTDDTDFTDGRGFYTSAVTTTVSATTPGAKIIYTLDGSEPTESNGTQVPAPNANTPPSFTLTIHPGAVPGGATGVNVASIGGVTTLRAAAFFPDYAPTNTDTQTYLFPTQVLGQTIADANARGWPSASVNGQVFNYGMDPDVLAATPQAEMLESLQSLPTLSIVTGMANFVDAATGIYVNADQHGAAWERPVSMEVIFPPGYVDPDGNASGLQINAGLRIRGGFSRGDGFFKHAFRLFFSGKYDGKLKYPMFGSEGVDEFGKLDLGTASNYGWQRENSYGTGKFNTFCRDPFARDTQGALGQPHTKSRYYHVYLNGHYWGIYYTEERAEAEFAASYMGGDDSEYDAVKCANHIGNFVTEATDGTLANWQTLWTKTRAIATTDASAAKYYELLGRNADGTRNPALPVLLDVDNLIDEMLVLFYMGDGDAVLSSFLGFDKPNNWFSVFRQNGADGFRFFIRDAEHTLGTTNWVPDHTGPYGGASTNSFTFSNPQRLHQDLLTSAEYKLRFADRVRRHFFDGGALTPAQCIARFMARANRVEKAMKAESARWGDAQSVSNFPAGHPPYYSFADWQAAVAYVTNDIMPTRTSTVLAQLSADGLFPSLAAPEFTDAGGAPHYGGNVAVGFQLRITAAAGAIYYTIDGTDPRTAGGGIGATAMTGASPISLTLNSTMTVRARAYDSATQTWSALTEGEYLVGALASAANIVISKIHYNPASTTDVEEFIEVMNIGAVTVDLTNCEFTAGIGFEFPAGYLLAPGARCLVVRDAAAHPGLGGQIAGAFATGTALNNGGEPLELRAADNSIIRSFAYDNNAPWPTAPDGTGPSLVLIKPATNPDPANPANWRASAAAGGSPGVNDATSFSIWAATNNVADPDADNDFDGSKNLLEYVAGTNPRAASPAQPGATFQTLTVGGVPAEYLTLSFTRAIGRDDATVVAEASSDLTLPWAAAPLAATANHGNGTETLTFRHPQPRSADARQFLRIKATTTP